MALRLPRKISATALIHTLWMPIWWRVKSHAGNAEICWLVYKSAGATVGRGCGVCAAVWSIPNHQDNNDEYNQTLYLSVISRLCYCAVVGVVDGGCAGCLYYHAEFSGNAVLNPLMIRRISLLQLQLWLSAEYALFFCVMCCVGWQFTRRTQSELKSRLHCWLVFAPVYLWLILWNIIFTSRQRKLRCWKVSAISFCLLSGYPEFFAILASAVDGFYRSNKRTAWFCVGILLPVAQQK